MHAYLEETSRTRSDCPVQCLSWMGKVPDGSPEEDGWKLNRASYYQEGWLATGNSGGIVGVTYTAAHSKKTGDGPPRSNFNLRGHRSEIVLVKWNEPYQKLATCDATGVIFVWIKHEGRWSIELINDRSSQVTDFTWSHDGRMALICYRDGFVLVGSVAGQRYWSSMLNLENCLVTSGAWSHDDQKVLFGTTDGQMIVMSASGVMLTQSTIQDTVEVSAMAWACEKFYLSEQEGRHAHTQADSKPPLLAISFRTGAIYLMSNYDDLCPKVVHTGLTGLRMEWSNDGEILAVAGFIRLPNLECRNEVRFYNRLGKLRYRLHIPHQSKPVGHLTWGHNDRRLFVAVGCHIYTAWITKSIASLQLLCRRRIQQSLRDEHSVNKLPLPAKIHINIQSMFCPTIRGYIPQAHKLREFVCIPPAAPERLHCTMIRQGEECSGGHYTLYLEYLGGLIPLLKGKRASKIRPEFIIFDPKIKTGNANTKDDDCVFVSSDSSLSDTDSSEDLTVEGCGSPRMQRRKKTRKLKDRFERRDSLGCASNRPMDELMYDDNLPEGQKLAEVTSNIWGTKFKLHSLASFLPEDLGQVLYKTSLLHLQPRQMTITIVEINPDLKPQARDPSYNPNHFSESEDEVIQVDGERPSEMTIQGQAWSGYHDNSVAISPEAPACPHPLPTLASPRPLVDGTGNGLDPASSGRHSVTCGRPALFVDRVDHLAPLEIRSLDGSPPQRRSPSFKPRALSPAEQHPLATNNSLVSGVGQTMLSGAVDTHSAANRDLLKTRGAISPNKGGSNTVSILNGVTVKTNGNVNPNSDSVQLSNQINQDTHKGKSTTVVPPSTLSVVQMAVRKCDNDINTDAGVTSVPPEGVNSEQCEVTNRTQVTRWADKACHELKYIDDDSDDTKELCDRRDAVFCNVGELSAREIMSSMQMLHQLEQVDSGMTGCGDLGSMMSTGLLTNLDPRTVLESQRKRVVLSQPSESKPRSKLKDSITTIRANTRCIEMSRGDRCKPHSGLLETSRSCSTSPTPSRRPIQANTVPAQKEGRRGSFDLCINNTQPDPPSNQSASVPTSPVHKALANTGKKPRSRTLASRSRLQSPLTSRRQRYSRGVDSSDDEVALSGDDITTSENYRNLETFQKAQLTRKLRRARTKSDVEVERRDSPCSSPRRSSETSSPTAQKRYFVMHNKAPMWNENSQVYQLDFGGRVTQESAKNFQIEFRGKQVMQFGRIDSNAYTLDFQYPFSATQAFAVALANVTQRLK